MHKQSAQRRKKVKRTKSDSQNDFLQSEDMEKNERLRLARTRKYRTAKDAAKSLGVPYGTYSGHEAGSRGFSEQEARHYARAFRVRLPWLLLEDGPMEGAASATASRTVNLVGYAAAGGDTVVFHGDAQGPFDEVPAPEYATEHTVAVQVRGTSMGRLYDGWMAFYDDVRNPPGGALLNRVCICGLADGRVMIKKLRPGSSEGLFHLESETEPTLFDIPVKWAARVKGMWQS